MATKKRKIVLSYSLTPGTKRALDLTAWHYKCTRNQILDCALYEFIQNNVSGEAIEDILKEMPPPLNVVRW